MILVEFDPRSQWYAASLTIAAQWLRTEGKVTYYSTSPPEKIRSQLKQLGLKTQEFEEQEKLKIIDCYAVQLGQRSRERYALDSLKVADLSIQFAREMHSPPDPDRLRISDNFSTTARFNDEKAWVEFLLSRAFPSASLRKETAIRAFIRGVHSEWAYKQLEAASDGVVEFRLDEEGDEPRNLISTMRNIAFDGRWHKLKVGENFEVTLEK